MTMKRWALALAVAALAPAARAAVDCTVREPKLRHVCDGGAKDGQPCDPDLTNIPDPLDCRVARPAQDTQCPGGSCAIDFLAGKGTTFKGVMTVIIDENVSNVNEKPVAVANVVAVTVLLDLGKLGTLAQTYQNLETADINALTQIPSDTFGVPLSESLLAAQAEDSPTTGKPRVVNDLVFRSNESEMATALRTLFGINAGVPVVTKVSSVQFTDARATTLGSVLRMKIKGAFVNP